MVAKMGLRKIQRWPLPAAAPTIPATWVPWDPSRELGVTDIHTFIVDSNSYASAGVSHIPNIVDVDYFVCPVVSHLEGVLCDRIVWDITCAKDTGG
jgi:hypothetical protein